MVLRGVFGVFLGFSLGVAIVAYYVIAFAAACFLFTIGLMLLLAVITAPLGLACIALGFKLLNP